MINTVKQYKKQVLIILIFLVLVISIIIIKLMDNDNKNKDVINLDKAVEIKEEIVKEDTIVIHITGEVLNQGIIKIPEGSRIADAIEKAGGLTENANLKNVNLAYELEDGQKLYIPSNQDENSEEYIDNGVSREVIIDSNNSEKNEMININKADAKELQTLNGIGEATAELIVKYREENGQFEDIEDLKNVQGIGDSKYEIIKGKIKTK
ncbi:MAG: ComEA family DNA-binding protein [Clostridia bacterium]|nr:ComEA family DNA-binding protein [Clostridia bacterium]